MLESKFVHVAIRIDSLGREMSFQDCVAYKNISGIQLASSSIGQVLIGEVSA